MPASYDADAGRLPSQGPGLLTAVRRHPLVVIGAVLVAVALGLLATVILPTNYVATSEVSIGDPNNSTIFSTVQQPNVTALAENAAQIMRSQAVYDRASVLVQHRVASADVSGAVSVTPATSSPIVSITATESSAKLARDLANAEGQAYLDITQNEAAKRAAKANTELTRYAASQQATIAGINTQIAARAVVIQKQFASIVTPADRARAVQSALQSDAQYQGLQSQAHDLQTDLASTRQKIAQTGIDASLSTSVDRLYSSGLPDSPTSSNLKRNLALAVALGLLAGVALAWRRFDHRRVIDPAEVAATLGAPMLGHIARSKDLRNPTQVVDLTPGRQLADDLRVLASSLMLHMRHSGLTRCVISSARVGEGKTVIALNLAAAASSAGHDVMLIDGDVRNSALTNAYQQDAPDSVFDLSAESSFGDQFGEVPSSLAPKLPVIPMNGSSTRSDIEAHRLTSAGRLQQSAIVDAPAIFEDPVTLWLASGPAGLVVIVSAISTIADLRTVRSRAELAGVRTLGFVVNDHRPSSRRSRKQRADQQRYRRGERIEANTAEDAPSAAVATR